MEVCVCLWGQTNESAEYIKFKQYFAVITTIAAAKEKESRKKKERRVRLIIFKFNGMQKKKKKKENKNNHALTNLVTKIIPICKHYFPP